MYSTIVVVLLKDGFDRLFIRTTGDTLLFRYLLFLVAERYESCSLFVVLSVVKRKGTVLFRLKNTIQYMFIIYSLREAKKGLTTIAYAGFPLHAES